MSEEIDDLLNNVVENLEPGTKPTKSLILVEDPNFLSSTSKKLKSDSPLTKISLSDSSDDEDLREHSATYSEYGRNIKKLLKHDESEKNKSPIRMVEKNTLLVPKIPAKKPQTLYVDPTFGLRMVNPLIAHNLLADLVQGKEVVHLYNLKRFINDKNSMNKDWIIAGVVIGKLTKTSQNGNQYTIWTLSDLKDDIKTFTVFLFGNSSKELWKCALGTVVGILNAKILEKKDNSKAEACLSVDNVQKVLVMGTSRDYGVCKSVKKDGSACSSVVNVNRCEYCVYHVKQEYQKSSNKRMDLQSSFSRLQNLRHQILNGANPLSKRSAILSKNKELRTKDDKRLNSLNNNSNSNSNDKSLVPAKVSQSLRNKDRDLLEKLSSGDATGDASKKTIEKNDRGGVAMTTATTSVTNNQPVLSSINNMVDLSAPPTIGNKNRAKLNALKWIQKNGPLPKSDPNSIKRGTKRPFHHLESLQTAQTSTSACTTASKKNKMADSEFSDRYKKIMAATSSHADTLDDLDHRKMDQHLDKLALKERMEEKMMTTYKMSCKSVTCVECKYTSFSAADRCKREHHRLVVKDATKRFFKCASTCANRIVTLDVYPTRACAKCGGFKWERTGMMKEKVVSGVTETLSIRGGEQGSVHSAIQNANINLLVPDS